MKVAVENAADVVVRGMSGTLKRLKQAVLMEIHRTDSCQSKALERLRASGHAFRRVDPWGCHPAIGKLVADTW